MLPVAIIGAGPAGLAAADVVAAEGLPVVVFEQMPSPGRKLLMAGLGGLNITHTEPADRFIARYAESAPALTPMIEAFTPDHLRQWCAELGEPTFVGTSGRVFPESFKASPLLRAWLAKLDRQGVDLRNRHRWLGWNEDGALLFQMGAGETLTFEASATILALGGATWPRLGSTGAWKAELAERGVEMSPFAPSNCGFEVAWSDRLIDQHEGKPLKNVGFHFGEHHSRAEAVITKRGLEGGAVYALSAPLRDAIAAEGPQTLMLDLVPDLSHEETRAKLAKAKAKDSLSNRLRKSLGLSDVQRALFFEGHGPGVKEDLAQAVKSVPIQLLEPFGLDWEAPTGGYLLQACMATGRWAGAAAAAFCKAQA